MIVKGFRGSHSRPLREGQSHMVSPQHSGRFVHGAARRTEASGGPIGKPDNKLNGMEKAGLCRHTCVQTHRDAVSSLAKQHAWAIGYMQITVHECKPFSGMSTVLADRGSFPLIAPSQNMLMFLGSTARQWDAAAAPVLSKCAGLLQN